MRILDIHIPDVDIDALAPTQQRILYAVAQAHPVPVGIGILLQAGGSGCQTRRKHLNEDFLALYGLTIESKPAGVNEAGTQIWKYALKRTQARIDEKGNYTLPMPERPETAGKKCEIGAK